MPSESWLYSSDWKLLKNKACAFQRAVAHCYRRSWATFESKFCDQEVMLQREKTFRITFHAVASQTCEYQKP